ncbi:hypothetical protein Pfo_018438 [Paulownia fortunei]|nr:hypothetical protein Pfo_018438 [Paulownia fortunei]
MGYAQFVIGPAGSGKSTYCSSLYQHCETVGRSIHIVNLDPAAENFDYPAAMDIRELISLDDVMEELVLGPNGGLIYCMEHLEENLDDWLTEELDNYLDDDYLVFDCPGQIELFSHVPVFKNFVEHLRHKNFNVCAVYFLDSQLFESRTSDTAGGVESAYGSTVWILSLIEFVDRYSMVSFLPLDLRKESSIQYILSQIDNSIQYGEDADAKVKDFDPEDD